MKKIAAVLTMGFSVILLAGCGTKSQVTTNSTTNTTAEIAAKHAPFQRTGETATGDTSVSTMPRPVRDNTIVKITKDGFASSTLNIKVGATVTWTNMDTVSHTVTDSSGAFDKIIAKGGSFAFTFTKPGTYTYRCSFHRNMTGTIIVK